MLGCKKRWHRFISSERNTPVPVLDGAIFDGFDGSPMAAVLSQTVRNIEESFLENGTKQMPRSVMEMKKEATQAVANVWHQPTRC